MYPAVKKTVKKIEGCVVVKVRDLDDDEKPWGDSRPGVLIVLRHPKTGALHLLVPMADEEGNGPGAIMVQHEGQIEDEPGLLV